MTDAAFASLDKEGVRVNAARDGDRLGVRMSGTVESRDPGTLLDAYWIGLDQAVRMAGVREVELDLGGLDYMNSSGLLTLVRWITLVKADPKYQILIRHDPNLTWQKTNVPVLAKLAPAVVRIAAL
ncbi:MAG: hypothetical protein ACRENS_08875 [Candidatus Eiseniibacteriota bacterium]